MVARLQRSVAEPFVDGQDRLVPVGEDAGTGHQHLVDRCWSGGGTVPAAEPAAALLAPASFHDVAVVAGQHHQPSRRSCGAEERTKVFDGLGRPVRTTGVGAVEGVVDGVEHAPH